MFLVGHARQPACGQTDALSERCLWLASWPWKAYQFFDVHLPPGPGASPKADLQGLCSGNSSEHHRCLISAG